MNPSAKAIKAVCPCGEVLIPQWVNGVNLRFQCRRHPDRLAIISHGGQVFVGHTISLVRPHDPYRHPVPPPTPPYRPTHPQADRLAAICVVCGVRAKHRDGGYHHPYWCPHHPGAPVFFVGVDQLADDGWQGPLYVKAWTGHGWSRMKAPKGQVKPLAVGHV